ncbi:rodlin [Streptomyces sp. NPDC052236]|uniref:rodlin n=1 Tax=Streptomyces sp. NPDC052236 TaxID=3365686 RepID=UPI0037D94450
MKKMIVVTVLAVCFLGMAPQAMAVGEHGGTTSLNDTRAEHDAQSKPCTGLPIKANVGSLVGLLNIAVQDIPILSAPQNLLCTENSSQSKDEEPLQQIVDQIPVLSGNGVDHH